MPRTGVPPAVDLNGALEAAAGAAVERRLAELQRPELVSQRTVLAVVGMPAVDFLEDARAGAFPSWKVRRMVFAATADVVAYVKAHPAKPRTAANLLGNDNDAEATIFAKYGARRVAE